MRKVKWGACMIKTYFIHVWHHQRVNFTSVMVRLDCQLDLEPSRRQISRHGWDSIHREGFNWGGKCSPECGIIPLAQGPRYNAAKYIVSMHTSFKSICLPSIFSPRPEGCHGDAHEWELRVFLEQICSAPNSMSRSFGIAMEGKERKHDHYAGSVRKEVGGARKLLEAAASQAQPATTCSCLVS